MKVEPLKQEGYQLLHEGVIALAQVEANGIRIDIKKLQKTKKDLTEKMRVLKTELEHSKLYKKWRRRFGADSNLTSGDQLATMLYDVYGFPITDYTESGKPSTDEETLNKIEHPALPKLIRFQKYGKALNTFLKGIEKEVVGDRLHPVFNLHTVKTYRGSSDSPNFQNFPVRDKEVSEIIRSHFIASPNSVIVENDFKGIEVGVSACYHQDSNFISYITTPGKDMHRDMAAQIYCMEPKEVSKDARYGAKNKFVFPQFYGDYYLACAKNLWEWIEKGKLTGPDGKTSLFTHLKQQGIDKLGACKPEEKPIKGTFEHHLAKIEDDFWNNRFRDYGQWRRDWYAAYLKKGYFDTYTGFRISGLLKRNQVTNFPIQGSAFHCLLWVLIKMVNKELRRYHMKSMVVGQIHDSLIGDVQTKELRDYLALVEEIATVRLRKHYDWLIVPLEIEYEIAPLNVSWFGKQEVKFKQGRFGHPTLPNKWTEDGDRFLSALKTKQK